MQKQKNLSHFRCPLSLDPYTLHYILHSNPLLPRIFLKIILQDVQLFSMLPFKIKFILIIMKEIRYYKPKPDSLFRATPSFTKNNSRPITPSLPTLRKLMDSSDDTEVILVADKYLRLRTETPSFLLLNPITLEKPYRLFKGVSVRSRGQFSQIYETSVGSSSKKPKRLSEYMSEKENYSAEENLVFKALKYEKAKPLEFSQTVNRHRNFQKSQSEIFPPTEQIFHRSPSTLISATKLSSKQRPRIIKKSTSVYEQEIGRINRNHVAFVDPSPRQKAPTVMKVIEEITESVHSLKIDSQAINYDGDSSRLKWLGTKFDQIKMDVLQEYFASNPNMLETSIHGVVEEVMKATNTIVKKYLEEQNTIIKKGLDENTIPDNDVKFSFSLKPEHNKKPELIKKQTSIEKNRAQPPSSQANEISNPMAFRKSHFQKLERIPINFQAQVFPIPTKSISQKSSQVLQFVKKTPAKSKFRFQRKQEAMRQLIDDNVVEKESLSVTQL